MQRRAQDSAAAISRQQVGVAETDRLLPSSPLPLPTEQDRRRSLYEGVADTDRRGGNSAVADFRRRGTSGGSCRAGIGRSATVEKVGVAEP